MITDAGLWPYVYINYFVGYDLQGLTNITVSLTNLPEMYVQSFPSSHVGQAGNKNHTTLSVHLIVARVELAQDCPNYPFPPPPHQPPLNHSLVRHRLYLLHPPVK